MLFAFFSGSPATGFGGFVGLIQGSNYVVVPIAVGPDATSVIGPTISNIRHDGYYLAMSNIVQQIAQIITQILEKKD